MRDKKILFIIFGAMVINIYFLGSVIFKKPINGMRVIYFDVGQGDANLVMKKDFNMLIDGGPDKKVIEKLDKYLPFWNRKIDIMILTHPHADHITGLIDVLEKYEVEEIWMTGVLHNSSEYLEFLETVRDKGIVARIVDGRNAINLPAPACADRQAGRVSTIENMRIEILYPLKNLEGKNVDNLNNSSIVLRVSYKDKSFLFTGDIEKEVEAELCEIECKKPHPDHLLEGEGTLNVDVLKIAHHGSNNSSTECFLEATQPKIAIISVGKDNDFGMPSLRVMNRLERMGIEVFRTDLDGDIVIEADGGKLVFGI